MKSRLAHIVDHVLISTWTFLGVLFLVAFLYVVTPPRWKDVLTTDVQVSLIVLSVSLLSCSRWLSYWDRSQAWWVVLTTSMLTGMHMLGAGAESHPLTRITIALFATWVIIFVAAPLSNRMRWNVRVKWGDDKQSQHSIYVKRQLELRAAEQEARKVQ